MAYSEATERGGGETGPIMVRLDAIHLEQLVLFDGTFKDVLSIATTANGSPSQIAPVELAVVEGRADLQVIDGQYRLAAMRQTGFSEARARVETLTVEELIDRQLTNVSTHDNIEVGRVVGLAAKAWSLTSWGANDVSFKQALTYKGNRLSAEKLGLDPSRVEGLKEWVDTKTALWGIGSKPLKEMLMAAEKALPEVIRQTGYNNTRQRQSGGFLLGHLSAIVDKYGHDMPAQQKVLYLVVRDNGLSVEQTKLLVGYWSGGELSLKEAMEMAGVNIEQPKRQKPQKSVAKEEASAVGSEPEVAKGPLEIIEHSIIKVPASDERSEDLEKAMVRIINLDEVNEYTKRFAGEHNFKPNMLEIFGAKAVINGKIDLIGPIQTRMLNSLLLTYGTMPPPRLEEIRTMFNDIGTYNYKEQDIRKRKLVLELVRLRGNGIVAFDELGDQRVFLAPMLIKDRRVGLKRL